MGFVFVLECSCLNFECNSAIKQIAFYINLTTLIFLFLSYLPHVPHPYFVFWMPVLISKLSVGFLSFFGTLKKSSNMSEK